VKKRWAICLLVFITVTAGVAVWLAARSPAQTELEAYKQELIAKGEKLAKENWLPLPRQGSNSASLLVETLSQFSTAPMGSGLSQYQLITNNHAKVVWRYDFKEPRSQNPPLDIWEAMEEMTQTNGLLYSNIMNAVHAGYVDVPYDYTTERFPMAVTNTQWRDGSPYPMFLNFRVVMPLSAHVCLRLRQNRPEDAWDELAALMELGQKTFCEPNITSLKSRAEIVEELCQTTWQLMQFSNLPETRLSRLQTAWEELDILRTVEPAFALQRAYVEDRYDARRRKLSLWHKSPKELFKILTASLKDFSATKKTLAQNAVLVRQSYTNEIAEYRVAQAELEAARSFCRSHAGAALTNKLPHADILKAVVIAATQRQMAIVAIALQRYRLENGRFPQTLSALQPAFLKEPPLDFMDGKLLRYKPDKHGLFLLYSVGLDGHDDGDSAWPKKGKNGSLFPWEEGQDMVWPEAATDAEVAGRMAGLQHPRPRTPAH